MPQLFLDCDGVLANFDAYAESIFGMPSREAQTKLGTAKFWQQLRARPDFFRTLELMQDARVLFNAVAHLNPIILTGCPIGGWAEPHKVDWAAEHFPGTKVITCISKNKRAHMHPGDILIDDYLKYKHLWEESGGIFIHHTTAANSIQHLKTIGLL